MKDARFRCEECGSIMPQSHIKIVHLAHPKPGRDNIPIDQCPECGEVNYFTHLCDEPGCTREVECGWTTKSAEYRTTCGVHMDANNVAKLQA